MSDTSLVEATAHPPQQQRATHPLVVLRDRLEARKGELRAALVDIPPDQFIRAVITSATINPELQACSWQSVWLACMRACRDGLLPDGVEGAIVPYKSTATWIPMYQGLLRRFRRSGTFKWVTADLVREGEEFVYFVDQDGVHFKHVPGDLFDAPIVKVYALATTLEGGVFVNVMTLAEANKIRNMSKASREDAPWKVWPEEMYKKTALRRLSKMLPNARDIVPPSEDDLPSGEGEQQPQLRLTDLDTRGTDAPRKPGAAAALEQFSGASPVEGSGAPSADGVTGEAAQGAGEPSAARDDVARDPASATIHDDLHARSIAAYKRGQQAKAEGHQRKALPGEYREKDRSREAICWTAGYDGSQLPEFDGEGKVLVP